MAQRYLQYHTNVISMLPRFTFYMLFWEPTNVLAYDPSFTFTGRSGVEDISFSFLCNLVPQILQKTEKKIKANINEK